MFNPISVLLLMGCLVLKALMQSYPSMGSAALWLGASLGLLVYLLWRAERGTLALVALSCLSVGLSLNGLVVLVNGGFMPVSDYLLDYASPTFFIPASTAHLSLLGDVLRRGYSIGDVVAGIGLALLAAYLIPKVVWGQLGK